MRVSGGGGVKLTETTRTIWLSVVSLNLQRRGWRCPREVTVSSPKMPRHREWKWYVLNCRNQGWSPSNTTLLTVHPKESSVTNDIPLVKQFLSKALQKEGLKDWMKIRWCVCVWLSTAVAGTGGHENWFADACRDRWRAAETGKREKKLELTLFF